MNLLKRLTFTASFVTSFPCLSKPETEAELSGLAKYLPTIGIIIGALLALISLACRSIQANELVSSFIYLLVWIGFTGAIHLDGLMDTADGLFSHRSKNKMLEIMKDSRVGNFGAISGIVLILAKLVSLISLPSNWLLASLFLIPAWARWVEVFSIASYPYAREEGMGKIWHDSTKNTDLLVSAAFPGIATLIFCYYFHSELYSLLIPLTILPGIAFTFWVYKTLGGQTGDTYGASVEFAEAAGLVLLALFIRSF